MHGHVTSPTFNSWQSSSGPLVLQSSSSLFTWSLQPPPPILLLLPVQLRRQSQEKHCTHSCLHSARPPASVPQTLLPLVPTTHMLCSFPRLTVSLLSSLSLSSTATLSAPFHSPSHLYLPHPGLRTSSSHLRSLPLHLYEASLVTSTTRF